MLPPSLSSTHFVALLGIWFAFASHLSTAPSQQAGNYPAVILCQLTMAWVSHATYFAITNRSPRQTFGIMHLPTKIPSQGSLKTPSSCITAFLSSLMEETCTKILTEQHKFHIGETPVRGILLKLKFRRLALPNMEMIWRKCKSLDAILNRRLALSTC